MMKTAERLNPEAVAAFARAAAARQDWPAALEAWNEYGSLKTDVQAALGRAEAYRSLENPAAADQALSQFSGRGGPPEAAISFALNANVAQDWEEALVRWHDARTRFPDVPAAWAGEAAILQILGQPAKADALACEGTQRFPQSIDVFAQHCNAAMALGEWGEVASRWAEIEARFGSHVYTRATAPGIHGAIRAGLDRMGDAQLLAMAEQADAAAAWPRARTLWRTLYSRAPDQPRHIIGFGRALRELQSFDEADEVLGQGIAAVPGHDEIRAQYAQVAAARLDWAEAARRWRETMEAFPDASVLWVMAATAFREAGSLTLADELLDKAQAVHPESVEVQVQRAITSERRGDWAKAVAAWDHAARLRPNDLVMQNLRGDAIWQESIAKLEQGLPAGEDRKTPAVPALVAALPDAERLKHLMLEFEGLGDNCEFGILQRRFGADPIGLFRFAAIQTPILTQVLRARLDPLGDPAFTELGLTAGNEYLLRDTRGLYFTHTFLLQGAVDPDKLLQQQIKRLGYLKRNLLEDLESGEKIFVHKASNAINDDELMALHAAVSAYGPSTLLEVRKVSNGIEPGSIELRSDRLMVGYVRKLYDGEDKQIDSQIDFTSWRRILEAASRRKVPGRA